MTTTSASGGAESHPVPVPGAPAVRTGARGTRPALSVVRTPPEPPSPAGEEYGAGPQAAVGLPAPALPATRPAPVRRRRVGPTRPPVVDPPRPGIPAGASRDAVLIRRTLAEVEPVSDSVTAYFYALLFVRHPALRELFPAAMDVQRDRLFSALLTAVRHVDDTDVLTEYLSALGRGHRKYGTEPGHYPAVGECLVGALSRYARLTWDAETEAAWVRAYTAISQIMIDAAAQDERQAPAWWEAELVGHELWGADVAVLTLRPDQPYPYRAGQYAAVETSWWPRVWRHYSFASAPRGDGLLRLHVKSVPAGWVSRALVSRARPGDVVRLGPPAGGMTVDHGTDCGLVCLGGGTGIAPVAALVEDVAAHGRRREVEVFYGARTEAGLYALPGFRELERRHPWLTVRAVVADGPPPPAFSPGFAPGTPLRGELPYVIRQFGPYQGWDGYLAGPPAMIGSGVDALLGVGVRAERIRHDGIDDLVGEGS